jgi:hypothetical protein
MRELLNEALAEAMAEVMAKAIIEAGTGEAASREVGKHG